MVVHCKYLRIHAVTEKLVGQNDILNNKGRKQQLLQPENFVSGQLANTGS